MILIKFYTNCLNEHTENIDVIRKTLQLNSTPNGHSYIYKKTAFRITK